MFEPAGKETAPEAPRKIRCGEKTFDMGEKVEAWH
jgi:hypothetical protein